MGNHTIFRSPNPEIPATQALLDIMGDKIRLKFH